MPYTESQMAETRKIDLLTFFQRYEPDGIRKPGRVTVFFKAKNEDLIMNVFREHSDRKLKNRDRTPIMSSIEAKAKELRNAPAKIKTMTPTVGER